MDIPKITLQDPFLHTVLICYLLMQVGELTEDQLTEILTYQDMVGLFACADAFGVVERKRLADVQCKQDCKVYRINENGKVLVREFAHAIPLSIRETAEAEAKRIQALAELWKSFHWTIRARDKGYAFCVTVLNELDGKEMMQVSLYAPTYAHALDIQKRFLAQPVEIAAKLLELFTKDTY